MDAFRVGWKSLYGHECSLLLKPLEFADLATQLRTQPFPKLLDALTAYFASPDEYVARARHPLQLFLRDPMKYLATAREAAPQEFGKQTTRLATALANIKRDAQGEAQG